MFFETHVLVDQDQNHIFCDPSGYVAFISLIFVDISQKLSLDMDHCTTTHGGKNIGQKHKHKASLLNYPDLVYVHIKNKFMRKKRLRACRIGILHLLSLTS